MSSRKVANEWLNIIIGHVAAQCGLGLGLGCTLVHFYLAFTQTCKQCSIVVNFRNLKYNIQRRYQQRLLLFYIRLVKILKNGFLEDFDD